VRRLRSLVGVAILAAAPAAAAAETALSRPLVFVKQRPVSFTFATIADTFGNFRGFEPGEAQPLGGGLFRLDPDGSVTDLLGRRRIAVRDPEISFDGERVVFAMKTRPRGNWQIWEVGVDGEGLRRISRKRRYNDLDPAWLPDGRLVFTTDRNGWADAYENLPSAQLAVMAPDGTAVEILRRHPAGQFNPQIGSDGLLYFTQWDFHDRRRSIELRNSAFDTNRFLLWKSFADGSGFDHPHFGAHTVFDFDGGYTEVREIPGAPGTFLATLADEFSTWGAGAVVVLDPRANTNRDAPGFLTDDVFRVGASNLAGRWRSPYPLADGRVAAAWSPGPVFDKKGLPRPHFELVLLDPQGSPQVPLHRDPQLWSWQPVEVRARTAPAIAPGARLPQHPYAILNSLDVANRGRNENRVENGDFQPAVGARQAKQVRVFREDSPTRNLYRKAFPRWSDPDLELLGTAPVERDGSFAVVVPADVPLQWEILDAAGEVLVRERFGAELRAGELRQCDGCHAPHTGRTRRTTNRALEQPANLSGQNVDVDGNGLVDLLETLGLTPAAR